LTDLGASLRLLMCCVASLVLAGPARAQEQPHLPARTPAADIIKDNLSRAAATPEQILELLNKDAGLMVEFKQALAKDAGMNGQVLIEADLSEAAIVERLHSDLRSRALATALLRRYGYLVPRLNPDSDLAAEHNLMLRERAQEIQRASERRGVTQEQPRTERTSECDLKNDDSCAPVEVQPSGDGRPAMQNPPEQRRTGPTVLRATDGEIPNNLPLDAFTNDGEAAASQVALPRPQSVLAAERQTDGMPEPDQLGKDRVEGLEDPISAVRFSTSNTAASASKSPAEFSEASHIALVTAGEGRKSSGHRAEESRRRPSQPEFEPVRMDHQPNPYANAPSLYDLYVQAAASNQKIQRFGLDVFRRGVANPEILPMDLPVGPDYIVGPGDSLSVNLWGGVSQRLSRTVDREGRVSLPEVGAVLVSGRTLAEVQEEVQSALRTQFRHVSADVSLQRLRTVRVYVVGEVAAPGGYDISSLSTPLNALFAAGGVTQLGSLRRLEHYRGKQLLEEVDAYDLLLRGIRGDAHRIENGDSLRVPPLGPTVTVDGMVRRPASYELHREKNLREVLDLAGGILPTAALRHIEVQRIQAHDKRTMLSLDLGEAMDNDALHAVLDKFAVQDGDEIHIFPIAPYNANAVFLEGHVLRPGRYSYREGMTLTDLVASYQDLLPEPSGHYAEIIRVMGPEYRPAVESFDLAAALEHPETAPKIQALDTVRIFGRYDLEAPPEVVVTGEVRSPGRYRTSGQQHLRDALYQAGGVTADAWLDSAQVFRQERDGTSRVFSVNLRDALTGDSANNIPLQPLDRILIHQLPQKSDPRNVIVRGEVARPGRYPLATNMRVSDLVRSAGGLLRGADPSNGDLSHYAGSDADVASPARPKTVTVNVAAAFDGNPADNPLLSDGDVLTVPQHKSWSDMGATVTIRGEVARAGTYGIQPGERVSSVLRRAGGLLSTAYPQAAVLERTSVREMQQQSREELIRRLEQESAAVKTSLTGNATEAAALQQSVTQQKERVLQALRKAPVSGRLVVHIRPERKDFAGSADDIELRAGDVLQIPKQPGFVLVVGQVYNSNAITYTRRKNAAWYLARAGGATQLANRSAIFIIRANGEVTSGTRGLWTGGALASMIEPGDVIVVPEKAVLGTGNTWKNIVAVAQVAEAGALAAAIAIP
jgi:polysaccharide biosynthesis/export protein